MIAHLFIVTFIVTACFDLLLRSMSLSECCPNTLFITSLKPYYESLSIFRVAVIAGIIGAVTQLFIAAFMLRVPTKPIWRFIVFGFLSTFVISALMGFPIRASGLFPELTNTYYKALGWQKGMLADGISGLIVNAVVAPILFLVVL